jgi:hypothetical protein
MRNGKLNLFFTPWYSSAVEVDVDASGVPYYESIVGRGGRCFSSPSLPARILVLIGHAHAAKCQLHPAAPQSITLDGLDRAVERCLQAYYFPDHCPAGISMLYDFAKVNPTSPWALGSCSLPNLIEGLEP